ncbi:AAA family ATPase [Janthinobacterium sp. 75]|uniref:ATP-dependent nuclease n=1 Tax=Janthinobacterium sp. 75 TaxID=2135628 RepID=UPI001063384D|nr:AAA family ATPase [Janthinobacterium sp. 75]TDY36859.1 putative AbiEii toxin of type IV toxin-antitoxin system [Janthinobacterium sp. 75]
MHFYKADNNRSCKPPPRAVLPCIVYTVDNWDDYHFKTLYHLCLVKKNGSHEMLGSVKILQRGEHSTQLPEDFPELPDEFFSLGQEPDYYKNFRLHLPKSHRGVLAKLNDVVVKPQLLEEVETSSGFRNSLIRFNDAKICLRDGLAILDDVERQKGYSFQYKGNIPGAETDVAIEVDLNPDDLVPGRILAIIGRNGVGKTQFMAKLARDLARTQRVSKETIDEMESAFKPARPLFSRVIALSFSAFDRFQRPEPQKFFSYIYCGVRDDSGGLSRRALESRHVQYLKRIKEQNRDDIWEFHVSKVVGVSEKLVSIDQTIEELEDGQTPSMSSGQSILAYFISAAIAYLKDESLVLFDEPEIHLHPNAVALLMQTLQALLEAYNSYAVIATHSPVVIQEVPRKRVIRFEREGNITSAHSLAVESFGENIAQLTRQVFETVEIPNFYKATFKELAKKKTFNEISALFDDQLSLHATAYLASLYEDGNA